MHHSYCYRRSIAVLRAVRAAVALYAAVLAAPGHPARAALDTVSTFITSSSDLSVGGNYTPSITPSSATTTDVLFTNSTYLSTTFDANAAALSFGTLNDDNGSQSLTITDSNSTPASIALNSLSNDRADSGAAFATDILFAGSGSNLTIQSSVGTLALNLNAGGRIDDAGAITLAGPVSIAGGQTISFFGNGTTTISGNIANTSGTLSVNNSLGTVILSGTNKNTGATSVVSGVLCLQSAAALPNSNVTVLSGGTLQLAGGFTTAVSPSSTLITGAGRSFTVPQGSLVPGAGALESVSGANTYTGLLNLGDSATTIGVDFGSTLAMSNSGTIVGSSTGQMLTLAGGGNGMLSSAWNGGNTVTTPGAGGLTKVGPGTWTLNGTTANSYEGPTIIEGGTLIADFANLASAFSLISFGSNLTLGGGALIIKGNPATSTSQDLGNATLTADTANSIALSPQGGQTLTLSVINWTRNAGSTIDLTIPANANMTTISTLLSTDGVLTTGVGVAYASANGGTTWAAAPTSSSFGAFSGTYATGSANYTSANNVDVQSGDTPGTFTVNTLRFNQATDVLTLANGASIVNGGILVTPNATNATIGGGNLTSSSAGGELAILNYGALGVSASITDNGSTPIAVSFGGTGSTTITGANTYTGMMTIAGGRVTLGSGGALNGSGSGASGVMGSITVGNGGTFVLNGGNIVGNTNATSGSQGTITVQAGGVFEILGTSTIGGMTAGGGQLNVSAGTTIINSSNATPFSNSGVAGNGIIIGSGNGANSPAVLYIGPSMPGTIQVGQGGTIVANGGGAGISSFGIIFQENGTYNQSAGNFNLTAGSGGGAAFGIYNISGGTLTSSNSAQKIFSLEPGGSNVVSMSTLNISGAGTVSIPGKWIFGVLGSSQNGQINLNTGGLLVTPAWSSYSAPSSSSQALNFNGGTFEAETTTLASNGNYSINSLSSYLTSSTNVSINVFAGGGTINTNGQAITITQALKSVAGFAVTAASAADTTDTFLTPPTVIFTGGSSGTAPTGYATLNASGQINGIVVTNGGAETVAPSSLLIINAQTGLPASGVTNTSVATAANSSGGLTVTDPNSTGGSLTLSGSDTFTGGLKIGGSANLILGNPAALNSASPNSVAFAAGSTGKLTLNGKGAITIAGLSTDSTTPGTPIVQNANSAASTLTIGNLATNTFAGTLQNGTGSGALSLTKADTGSLTLSGANTYTGATTVSAGTLQLGSGGTTGSLSASSAITVNGTLAFNRSDNISQGTQFSGSAITGTGGLTQMGSGTLTLTAANTYSGGTTVVAGTLRTTVDNAVASGRLTNNATVNLGGNESVAGLSGTATSANLSIAANKTFTVNSSVPSVYAGSTSISGTLATTGTAVVELQGAASFATGSALSVGGMSTLRLNLQSGQSGVVASTGVTATVASGATLELDGSISALTDAHTNVNRVNVSNNGSLIVGNALIPETAGNTQQVGEIDGGGSTTVTDGASLTANHINQALLVIGNGSFFALVPSDVNGIPMAAGGGLMLAGSLWQESSLASSSDSLLGVSGSAVATPATSPSSGMAGASVNAVPEPTTAALLMFGVAMAAWGMRGRECSV